MLDAKQRDRFMKKTEELSNGCWLWQGARSRGKGNKKWYGSFRVGSKSVRAHTFAHDYLAGKVCPPGHHRDHLCNLSLCVNPDHIEAVPKATNQERRVQRRKRNFKHEPGLMAFC